VRVRPAQVQDAEALLALRAALWPDRDPAQHRRAIEARAAAGVRHETLVVEEPAGGVCGFAELTREPAGAGEAAPVRLDALFVAPRARRQGAARALLGAAERWAHARGAGELACELDATDDEARAVLARLGFGAPREILRLRRTVSAPLEVARPGPGAPAGAPPPPAAIAAGGGATRRGAAFWLLHLALIAAGAASFAHTDIYARDALRGVLLPLLDAALVLYFLFLFVILRYRKRADPSARAERLFRDR